MRLGEGGTRERRDDDGRDRQEAASHASMVPRVSCVVVVQAVTGLCQCGDRGTSSPARRSALRDRHGSTEGVERLADERRELADVLRVIVVEVTSAGLVAELEEAVHTAVLTADARGEPTA